MKFETVFLFKLVKTNFKVGQQEAPLKECFLWILTNPHCGNNVKQKPVTI